ncbi:MAG: extracellular solute-binding protein [Candidatus Promineifilaceae bacterium]
MNKRTIWILLFIAIFLVACGSEEQETATPQPAPTEPPTQQAAVPETTAEEPAAPESAASTAEEPSEATTVRFAVLDLQSGMYNDLIDAFEEENPDIDIKTVSVEEVLDLPSVTAEWPDDAQRRLVSAADVSSYFYSDESVQDGLLLDLTPLMEADRNFDPADFQPGTLEYFQTRGGTWAIPTAANYELIFFNRDLFDQAGADYPQAGWTWDDFLEAAEALTIGEGEETSQWGFVEASPNPALMVQSIGGRLFDMSAEPPAVMLDDPAALDALRWYTDLYLTHQVAPYYPSPDEEASGLNIPEGYLTIEAGQAAMWPEFSASYPYRSQQMNVGVAPFPADAADAATNPMVPDSLAISIGTANPEAAWRWLDFLGRQSTDLGAFFGGASTLPARLSTAEASGFWDEVDEELGAALAYAVDRAFPTSAPEGGYAALRDAFEAVMDGEKSVEAALADAQIAAEDAIEAGQTAQEEAADIIVQQDDDETTASEDAVTIEFVSVTGMLEQQTFRDLARQFLAENPDVVVEIKQPNIFQGTPTFADIAGNSDCFQWFPGNFNDPEVQDAILNLDPFLDADASITAEEFYPAVFEAFTAQGQTWGLPGQVNINLIEYNQDLFDEAGVAYPDVDWTVDEFLEIAVALTSGDGETQQYGYVPDLFEPSDMINMLDRFGVRLLDYSQDPPAVAFDSPEAIEAVRWYTGLTTEYGVKPILLTSLTGPAVSAVQQRESLLSEGRAAMWVNAAFNVDLGGTEARTYQTGAVPLPVGSGEARGSGYQSAVGYFISTGTEQREACWRWIKFLTEQPTAGRGLPSRIAVAESEAFRQYAGPVLADAYLASMANATEPPFAQQFSDQNSWLGNAVLWLYGAYDKIINKELKVEEALADAQKLADEYRACVIAAEAFNDGDAQNKCMMETDETLPAFLFATQE